RRTARSASSRLTRPIIGGLGRRQAFPCTGPAAPIALRSSSTRSQQDEEGCQKDGLCGLVGPREAGNRLLDHLARPFVPFDKRSDAPRFPLEVDPFPEGAQERLRIEEHSAEQHAT